MSSTEENKKENRHSTIMSWIGTIAGIIGLIVTIFVSVKKNEPKLEYTIVSKIDFFNNSEPVPYIKVFLADSINVQENNYNITAYNIKVENKGTKHIKYSDYDEGFFGLKVDNGTLLDAPGSGGFAIRPYRTCGFAILFSIELISCFSLPDTNPIPPQLRHTDNRRAVD